VGDVWATSLASFLMDVSSEMVLNLLPLFLTNALGVRTHVVGLVEGVARQAVQGAVPGGSRRSENARSVKSPGESTATRLGASSAMARCRSTSGCR
jgi:hypothetical protein